RLVILSDLNQINNSMLLLALISNDIQSGHTHCRDTINKRGNKKDEKTFILGDYEYNKRAASL
ncbi:hypothetical protein HMPREF9973_12613, partial [Staphylococcus epidermidis NIH05001]